MEAAIGTAIGILVGIILCAVFVKRAVKVDVQTAMSEAFEDVMRATAHHTEVNAVLALTRTFREASELLENLSRYSNEVVAAALIHRVNALGSQLKTVREQLAKARKLHVEYGGYQPDIERAEATETQLMEELVAANAVVQTFNDSEEL